MRSNGALRERGRQTTFTYLLLWDVVVTVLFYYIIMVNLLLCLIHKLNFTAGVYIYRDRSCPWFQASLGVLEHTPRK